MPLAVSSKVYNQISKDGSNEQKKFSQDYYDVLNTFNRIAASHPLLNKEEERGMIEAYRNDRHKLNQLLFCHNIRIVLNIAKKYLYRSQCPADLLMNGARGLMIAAEKFDPDKNIKFNTYATSWVFKYILMLFYSKSPVTGVNQISLNINFHNGDSEFGSEQLDYLSDNYGDDEISSYLTSRGNERVLSLVDYSTMKKQATKTPSRECEESFNASIIHSIIKEIATSQLDNDIIYNNLMSNNESVSAISARYSIPTKEVNKRKHQLLEDFKEILSDKYNVNSLDDIL